MDEEVKLSIKQLATSQNIAELIDEDSLTDIGRLCIEDFDRDKDSRSEWETRTEDALKLALQVVEDKTFPWPDASNVKFPLLTIASLQFHARAYPALVSSQSIVRCKVIGPDPDGMKTLRAERVSSHMSYQLLEEDENWEDQMDKVLITMPIIGCAFKKTYYDAVKGHNVSENILAKDLVVPYFTKSLETASRVSHILYLTHNDIYERVARGVFCEFEEHAVDPTPDLLQEAQNEAQGVHKPQSNNDNLFEVVEQHRLLDLDGDGYQEPYIVTVRRDTKQVLRIVARYYDDEESILRDKAGGILSIKSEQYFTKYPFVPSPDGGFYDLGFGVLLGPLNESINTLINQLIDAGTMATTGGGFLGRGVKIKGGDYTFKPLEWKRVDSTGDDLRKSIVPLPVREPSQVLFTLLSLLINYGERIAGATDIMTGVTPGQNTPAETARTAVNQGMKIFSGIFKRTYRSLKEELRKEYRLNQIWLNDTKFDNTFVMKEDYLGKHTDISPNCDPNVAGEEQRLQQAQALMQLAQTVPGFDKYQVTRKYLEAIHVSDIDKVYPDPKGPNAVPPPPNPKIQVEEMKLKSKEMQMQIDLKLGMMGLMKDVEESKAKTMKLEAEAIKLLAEAQGVETGHQIALLQTQIGAAKAHQDGILKAVGHIKDMILKGQENERNGLEGVAQQPGHGDVPQAPAEAQGGNLLNMG